LNDNRDFQDTELSYRTIEEDRAIAQVRNNGLPPSLPRLNMKIDRLPRQARDERKET